jgi:hypothetical protein
MIMKLVTPEAIEAVADAWASIDGKAELFRSGKTANSFEDEPGGHYSGYMAEAAELISRLRKRGFDIIAAPPTRS